MKPLREQILSNPWVYAYEDLGEYTDRNKMHSISRNISSRPVWMDVLRKLVSEHEKR